MKLSKERWGFHNGKDVFHYRIDAGTCQVSFSNYGCVITTFGFSYKSEFRNVVLGYDTLRDYVNDRFYIGCVVGRFANRIEDATFTIDGQLFRVSNNEADLNNHLHGGHEGFNRKVFGIKEEIQTDELAGVCMNYISADGEEGFPGNVDVQVWYELDRHGQFTIRYRCSTDRTTNVNLTNHTYFNLNGRGHSTEDHSVCVPARHYLESNSRFLPTGKIIDVQETPFDLRVPVKVEPGHNTFYLLETSNPPQAILQNKEGISLSMNSSLPGLLLYTGDYLDKPFKKNEGVCLEFQFPPNAPNLPNLPSTLLQPGELYDHFVTWKVSQVL